MKTYWILTTLLILFSSSIAADYYQQSYGFGTFTKGGLEGEVIHVTTLANDGPGSLRQALAHPGPRLIVFDVGGVIDLQEENIEIRSPFCTLAGQTAPEPGITLIRGGLRVTTHDVVVQHLAVRPGDAGKAPKSGWAPDAITLRKTGDEPVYNVVFDHCSATWAVDENVSIASGDPVTPEHPHAAVHDVTFFKCLIAEGLSHATHSKGEHSRGSLISHNTYNLSIIDCVYAHNVLRNPRCAGNTLTVMGNSIIYNWGVAHHGGGWDISYAVHLGDRFGKMDPAVLTAVGNVCIKGPNSTGDVFIASHKTRPGKAYVEDNIAIDIYGTPLRILDDPIMDLETPKVWPKGYRAQNAGTAAPEVLRTVGARPAQRDTIDSRIIHSIIHGTGHIIDSQDEVGGYPDYERTTRQHYHIPGSAEDRRYWLLALSQKLQTDETLDTSPLARLLDRAETRFNP